MSTPLVPTDALRAAVSKTVKNVLKVSVVVAVLAGAVAYFSGGALAGVSGLIGGVVGILLALVTWFTMSLAMKNLDSQAALMVGDYLFKVVVVIATVLIVKNLTGLNHTALGLALILSVIAQATVQTWTLASSKVPTIDLPKDEKE
ncbi:hypothetical protein [Actinomyces sp. HMSC065F11]|uniref:hypothetical protein n=1 Tax=Actinomyces sp. HMSC065F11 TaxID=1739395 RepID=UPI0008A3C9CF|nr:hypothetical protein [Actinomyces sp. HMSC065F11]MDK8351858.1 hypothetical protein [Gleimia europaea]MDK8533191.1 hypothetical protein [Gleimia europaea]OFR31253.1 hypothetical protein HMPREF2891_04215 [Actinomyces sp. HMSC065F11]